MLNVRELLKFLIDCGDARGVLLEACLTDLVELANEQRLRKEVSGTVSIQC
jgi:hypothetical protein